METPLGDKTGVRSASRLNSNSSGMATYSGVKFVKMKGFAKTDGPMYEVKVAALLFLRCANSEWVQRFQLAANLDGAGALDDVVLRFTNATEPDRWFTCFVQLKHKEHATLNLASLTAPSGDFSLVKYLKSIVDIEKKMTTETTDCLGPFGGSFEDCSFVLYTNANSTVHPSHRTASNMGEVERLLGTNSESFTNECIFHLSSNDIEKVVATVVKAELGSNDTNEISEEGQMQQDIGVVTAEKTVKYTRFLQRMAMFSGQPTVSDLDDIIKKQLLSASYKGQTSFNVDQVYPVFVDLFKQWWANSEFMLDDSKSSDILQEALVQLRMRLDKGDTMLLNINFLESTWDSFEVSFQPGVSVQHVITDGESVRLSYTKVIRLLERRRQLYASFRLGDFLNDLEVLSSMSNDRDLIVVGYESSEIQSLDHILQAVEAVDKVLLRSQCDIRLIIVSSHHDVLISCLKMKFGVRYRQTHDIFFYNHLDANTIQQLHDKEIMFQGIDIALTSLKSFFPGNTKSVGDLLTDSCVEYILTSNMISIGPLLVDVVDYYIPRSLSRMDVLQKNILQSAYFTEVFAVSGVSVEELACLAPPGERVGHMDDIENSHCQIVVVDSKNTDDIHNYVVNNKNIHSLSVDHAGQLKWIASQKNIEYIRKYIIRDQYSYYQPDTAVSLDARVTLVVAEPGMGKTTLINQLAKMTKENYPDLWVIRVNLNDYTDLLESSSCVDAVEFLASAVGVKEKPPLEKALFRFAVEQTGAAVVLLDGFDEIAPGFTENALNLVKNLLTTKVKKVWITSRHSMKDILEQHLSTISFNLQPFSAQDQRTFFKRFWNSSGNTCSVAESQLDDFITQLQHLLSATLLDKDKLLPGIPLQTMILAEVFASQVMNLPMKMLPDKLDLLYLFETFVDKKFQIFIKEKVNLNSKNIKYLLQTIKSKFEMDHMSSALVLLVPSRHLHELHSSSEILEESKQFFEYVQDANDKTGIVYNVFNNQPKFIHRTFAEYFAALWFSKHYELNRRIVKEHLFSVNFGIICSMFDRLLAKGLELHMAVLNNDISNVESLLLSGDVDVDATDRGGRSGLHLAAASGFEYRETRFNYIVDDRFIGPRPKHMAEIFLEQGANPNKVDRVLKWTPLQYAFKTKTWNVMEFILSSDRQISNSLCSFIKLSEISHGEKEFRSILHWASEFGYLHLVESLTVDFGADPGRINILDSRGFSPIHLAAYRGYSEVVKVLILRGADIRAPFQEGKNSLHIACEKGHLLVAQVIIDSIGDMKALEEYINIQDLRGNSAVLHATYWGYMDIVRLLLSCQANVRMRDRWGRTCLHKASQQNHLQIASLLLDSLADFQINEVDYVNMLDFKGFSAIHWASFSGSQDIIKLLINHSADIKAHNKKGRNCLHMASEWNRLEVARALIENLSDDHASVTQYVNTKDALGISALQIASTFGFSELVQLLIAHGGDVWTVDDRGRTCLHVAATSGCLHIAETLVNSIRDRDCLFRYLNIQDSTGLTARDISSSSDSLGLFTDKRATLAAWLDKICSLNTSCSINDLTVT